MLINKWTDDVDVLPDKHRKTLETIVDAPDSITRSEIVDRTDISMKHVCNTIEKCADREWLDCTENAGKYNADVFDVMRVPKCIFDIK
jgi:MarR-like DNA-binding transcriptional regulator SgrR of sgrS sRNA